ncbi:MAG: sigma-70 family RNA polymerase sigma factor [Polyangiales bacterium]
MLDATGTLFTTETVTDLSQSLLHFALRSVPRREDAEDLVQETWCSALRSAASFEGRASLKSWLTSILRRRIADRYRRERLTFGLDEDALPSPDASPGEQQAWDEAVALVSGGFTQLAALEQRALVLCEVEGRSRDEVAGLLGITRVHLRVLLHRARTKLQPSLRRGGFTRGAEEEGSADA